MDKIKRFLKFCFGSLKGEFLLRSYVIASIYMGIIVSANMYKGQLRIEFPYMIYYILSFILFPFSKYLWKRLVFFITDAEFIIQNIGLFTLIIKLIINGFLFFFSILIFPISVCVLYIDIKNTKC